MRELGIDIETYSSADIRETGVYRYAEADDFEVLLFAYSIDGGTPTIVDLANGEPLPEELRNALTDASVLKTAYNAAFERVCLSRYLGTWLDASQWDCTMVRAARLGFPLGLAATGAALRLDDQKMTEGKRLINYFSKPCRPTKSNGGVTRHKPSDAPEDWETFKRYCIRDVVVEQEIRRRVTRMPVTDTERELWLLDQRINDRGVMIDTELAYNANRMDSEYKAELTAEAQRLTGLENPNSVAQLKEWLRQRLGRSFPSLNKTDLATVAERCLVPDVKRMLQIRAELGKTSTKKYAAMLASRCKDDRVRGLLQFYGAARTGRWAGRLVQLQNLPQNHLKDLDFARDLVKQGDLEELEMNYANVPATLSELIRTAFIAKPGCTFHVCDFSAIEARVIAWIAGEQWVLDTFRHGGDIYCSTASKMFGVPVEKHGANSHLRPKGKISVLALGYQGGVGSLRAMGGERLGLSEQEMAETVTKWRQANPHIVRLWSRIEKAAMCTITTGEKTVINQGITFERKWGGLAVTLPSGRSIYYPRAEIGPEGRITYEGQNQTNKTWSEIETYGGKMTENIVQATARDCLAETMLKLDRKGFNIVFHVHDEVIIEATPDQTLEEIEAVFASPIPWAKGLPLQGAGYTTKYYLKD